ncbi:MAG: exopolysaccharide biosynthesis protein exod [Pseudooceanicola sp.]|jgi:hypothetical protein|nr:exopolysaccharide biosynthesis protein exod [Pseudooceanicola sp.]
MTDATADHQPTPARLRGLTDLLDALRRATNGDKASVEDLLGALGERSFTPLLLAISVILISPVSGIPTVPTISAVIIVLIAVQGLMGRRHLWLPGFLLRRRVDARKLRRGFDWLQKPCAWVDRHSHARLRLLTRGPARTVAFLVCVLLPLTWPALELLPMVTSVGATALALLTFGLLTHDGLYALLGYCVIGTMGALVWWLI